MNQQQTHFSKRIKNIACVVLLAFCSVMFQDFMYAVPTAIASELFCLSPQVGKIVKEFHGKSKKQVYLIQNLHCHKETQKNIKEIINYLKEYHGRDLHAIGVEGSSGKINTSIFGAIENTYLKDKIVEFFLKKGYLTGAELYDIMHPKKMRLYGLEDWPLYLKNFESLYFLQTKQQEIESWIQKQHAIFTRGKEILYTPELYSLEREEKLYKEGKKDIAAYFLYLKHIGGKKGIAMEQTYPMLTLSQKMHKLRQSINLRTIAKESKYILEKMRHIIGDKEREKLEQNRKNHETFYPLLRDIIQKKHIIISKYYPQVDRYFQYIDCQNRLDQVTMMHELDDLLYRTKLALAQGLTDTELLIQGERYFEVFKKVAMHCADVNDLKLWNANREKYYETMETLDKKLNWPQVFVQAKQNIKEIENTSQKFYSQAKKRNEVLVKNLLKQDGNIFVAMIGGFHTEGMMEILRSKGIGYTVIMPSIETNYDRTVYEQRIDEQAKMLMNSNPSFEKIAKGKSMIFQQSSVVELISIFTGNIIDELFVQKLNELQKQLLGTEKIQEKTVRALFREILKNKKVFEWKDEGGQTYIFYADGNGRYVVEIEGVSTKKQIFFPFEPMYFEHGIRKSLDKEEILANPRKALERLTKKHSFELIGDEVVVRPAGRLVGGGIFDFVDADQEDQTPGAKNNNNGNAFAKKQKYVQAIVFFQQAINFPLAQYNLGNVYYLQKKYNEAITAYTQAIEQKLETVSVYNNRASAYVEQGKYDKAISDYLKALSLNPSQPQRQTILENIATAYYNKGLSVYRKGNHNQAIEAYTKALEYNPTHEKAFYNRGIAYAAQGEPEKAENDYTKVIFYDSKNISAYNNRGVVRIELGKFKEAVEDFKFVIENLPANHSFLPIVQTNLAYAQKRYNDAIKGYSDAIAKNPKDFNTSSLYYLRGKVYMELRQFENARKDFESALQLDPCLRFQKALQEVSGYLQEEKAEGKSAEKWVEHGNQLKLQRRYEEALDAYTNALTVNPRHVEACLNKGKILLGLKRFDEAQIMFDTLLIQDPHHKEGMRGKGLTLFDMKQYPEALEIFNTMIRDAKEWQSDIMSDKAATLFAMGRYAGALTIYGQITEREPDNIDILEKKEWCRRCLHAVEYVDKAKDCMQRKKHAEAMKYYSRALILDPENTDALIIKGRRLFSSGKFQEALVFFEKSIRIDQDKKEAWRGKGLTLLQMQKYNDALTLFDTMINRGWTNSDILIDKADVLFAQTRYTEALDVIEEVFKTEPKNIKGWDLKAEIYKKLNRHEEAKKASQQKDFLDNEKKLQDELIGHIVDEDGIQRTYTYELHKRVNGTVKSGHYRGCRIEIKRRGPNKHAEKFYNDKGECVRIELWDDRQGRLEKIEEETNPSIFFGNLLGQPESVQYNYTREGNKIHRWQIFTGGLDGLECKDFVWENGLLTLERTYDSRSPYGDEKRYTYVKEQKTQQEAHCRYDEDRQIIWEEVRPHDQKEAMQKAFYRYNEVNVKVEERYFSDQGIVCQRLYDNDERLEKEFRYEYPQEEQEYIQYMYQYTKDGHINRKTVARFRKSKMLELKVYNREGKFLGKTVPEYNADGEEIARRVYDRMGIEISYDTELQETGGVMQAFTLISGFSFARYLLAKVAGAIGVDERVMQSVTDTTILEKFKKGEWLKKMVNYLQTESKHTISEYQLGPSGSAAQAFLDEAKKYNIPVKNIKVLPTSGRRKKDGIIFIWENNIPTIYITAPLLSILAKKLEEQKDIISLIFQHEYKEYKLGGIAYHYQALEGLDDLKIFLEEIGEDVLETQTSLKQYAYWEQSLETFFDRLRKKVPEHRAPQGQKKMRVEEKGVKIGIEPYQAKKQFLFETNPELETSVTTIIPESHSMVLGWNSMVQLRLDEKTGKYYPDKLYVHKNMVDRRAGGANIFIKKFFKGNSVFTLEHEKTEEDFYIFQLKLSDPENSWYIDQIDTYAVQSCSTGVLFPLPSEGETTPEVIFFGHIDANATPYAQALGDFLTKQKKARANIRFIGSIYAHDRDEIKRFEDEKLYPSDTDISFKSFILERGFFGTISGRGQHYNTPQKSGQRLR